MNHHIETLYQVFGAHRLEQHVEGCPCCVKDSDQKMLRSKPLRELTGDDLCKYSRKAMTTWGTEADFKCFLPRMLELMLEGAVLDSVFAKLRYAKWTGWPEPEQMAVRNLLLLWWEQNLNTDGEDAFWRLRDLSEAEYILAPYLETWTKQETSTPWVQFAEMVVYHLSSLQAGHDRAGHPKIHQELVKWMFDPAQKQKLLGVQRTTRNSDHLEVIENALYVLELLDSRC